MEITLYKNFSKRKNSTKQPTGGETRSVKLKDDTSIENPVFVISNPDFEYNYCYALGHYYFIVDIILITNNLYEIQCQQDLLATYKTAIGNSTQFIERSASESNNMLVDSFISSAQNLIDVSYNITTITGMTKSDGCYIVRIVDGQSTGGITGYIVDNLSSLNPLFDKSTYYEDASAEWYEKAFFTLMNPLDYVISVQWIPFTRSSLATWGICASDTTEIFIKWWGSGIQAYHVTKQFYTIATSDISAPTTPYTDFRKYTPRFTQYKMYIPSIGFVDLSGADLSNGALSLVMTIDFLTGDMSANLTKSGTQADIIAHYTSNLYQQVQLGSANPNYGGVISTGLSTIGMAMSGNVTGTALGTIEVINNIVNPTPSYNGGLSGGVSCKYYNEIIVVAYTYGTGGSPVAVCGAPLMENRTINTLSGYIKCGNASLDISALGDDRDKINMALNGGFYYE